MSTGTKVINKLLKFSLKYLHFKPIKELPVPPKKLFSKYHIIEKLWNDNKYYYIQKKEKKQSQILLFLHGGAYKVNAVKAHWNYVDNLIQNTTCDICFIDYPLIPKTYNDSFEMIHQVYKDCLKQYPIVHIVGDSAGGGFALSFAMDIRDKDIKQPSKLILISPWLDVSMSNPDIKPILKHDPILMLDDLVLCGKEYSNHDPKNQYVSPIYGTFNALPDIHIFIGTHDLLYADVSLLMEKTQKYNHFNYYIFPELFHDFPLYPVKESKIVNTKIYKILK